MKTSKKYLNENIVITVLGGVVQNVYCKEGMKITIIDYDNDPDAELPEELFPLE